ncbi:MAG: hypothetical protein R2834_06870 [Rhodothermales bacterium]
MLRRPFVWALLLLSAFANQAVYAQQLVQTTRPFSQSIQALGMGDAVAGIPSTQTAFFYNPAHFAYIPPMRPILNAVGLRATFNEQVVDQVRFYRDEMAPAIDEGLSTLRVEERAALYGAALDMGRDRAYLNATVPGPSLMFRMFGLGVGVGAFGSSYFSYTYTDAGGGVPQFNMTALADVMVVAGAAKDLSTIGIKRGTLGLTVKYIRRSVSSKNKPIDVMGSNEPYHVLSATGLSADLGLQYELGKLPFLPGRFYAAGAVYDVVTHPFSFSYDRMLAGTYNPVVADREAVLANDAYGMYMSYRAGVAYVLPSFLGIFKESGLAIDYVGSRAPVIDQDFLARLHIGAQVHLPFLSLRAGLNQGYPALGAGIALGFIRVDYAYFGYEEGRVPGQAPAWNHSVEVRLGLF